MMLKPCDSLDKVIPFLNMTITSTECEEFAAGTLKEVIYFFSKNLKILKKVINGFRVWL
jgi:hypothetical protein